jgi:hypothetical protein
VCPDPPYFSVLFHKRHDFGEEVTEHNTCVLIFSTTFIGNISHSKKNSAKCSYTCAYAPAQSTCCSFHIVIKLGFSRQIFEKYSNIKFQGSSSSRSRVVPCRQTDMTKLMLLFAILRKRMGVEKLYHQPNSQKKCRHSEELWLVLLNEICHSQQGKY